MYYEGKGGSIEDRKLFVGGLGWDSTEKHLNEYFGKFGEVESINVKTNPNTGRSRGFAFIVFANTDSIDQILDGAEHIINGRKVDTKKAISKTGKIFVGGLKAEISDDDIKNFFSQFGKVIDVKIPFDKERNQRKGFCFITFAEEHVVNDLLKNPQQMISGVPVDLRKATPKTDATFKGSFGDGRGGGGGGGGGGNRRQGGYGSGYGNDSYNGYDGYGYESSYPSYGGNYSHNRNNGYNYSSSYNGGYDPYSDGQNSKDGSHQQSRYQPY